MSPHDGQDLLKALAVVLGVAAVTSTIFRLVRLPVVLGYLVAGIVIGPHVPIPLVANPAVVRTLSELGVILLMFFLGLEFSVRKLFALGASVAITAIIECSLLFWFGFAIGRVFGWTARESLFTGAIVSISSTTIIAKTFEEQGITGKLRELVVGVLIVEDLIAIMLMAMLTPIASGISFSPASLGLTTARLGGFLVALLVLGLLVVPRAMRRIVAFGRPEATIVASIGLCFVIALLARELGYSVALGAFLAGSLVAESGEERAVEQLVRPVRDVFAAVFFVSVGMMIAPGMLARHWFTIVVLTMVVVLGKVMGVTLGAFLTGHGARTSIQTGMSLAQIGEFSFIIAGLGLSLQATREFLYPVAVAVSAITTLLTPWLVRASGPIASWVDRKLPGPLQTLVSLYGSWLERLRAPAARSEGGRAVRRLLRWLIADVSVLAAIIIAGALGASVARTYLVGRGLAPDLATGIVTIAVAVVAAPFCIGAVRVARKLGTRLAEIALPVGDVEHLDLAAAPRRALEVTLQLAILLLVGAPLMAVTQPFLPGFHGAELLFGILLILAFAAWRTARNLHGHVRAGAEVIVEALGRQSRGSVTATPIEAPVSLSAILQGLGEPVAIELVADSPAVGKSLADLNVRGATGATVLAITRGDEALFVPPSRERLRAGDRLVVAGSRESVDAARLVLTG